MADVVEVTVAPNVGFAELLVAELKAAGIEAFAKGNLDRSYYAGVGAVSVFVDAADEEAALAIVEDQSRELPADPDDEHIETALRRRRSGAAYVLIGVLIGIPILALAIDAVL